MAKYDPREFRVKWSICFERFILTKTSTEKLCALTTHRKSKEKSEELKEKTISSVLELYGNFLVGDSAEFGTWSQAPGTPSK